jgi:hypothetical protein
VIAGSGDSGTGGDVVLRGGTSATISSGGIKITSGYGEASTSGLLLTQHG